MEQTTDKNYLTAVVLVIAGIALLVWLFVKKSPVEQQVPSLNPELPQALPQAEMHLAQLELGACTLKHSVDLELRVAELEKQIIELKTGEWA